VARITKACLQVRKRRRPLKEKFVVDAPMEALLDAKNSSIFHKMGEFLSIGGKKTSDGNQV
jgi:hypothetical protein